MIPMLPTVPKFKDRATYPGNPLFLLKLHPRINFLLLFLSDYFPSLIKAMC
jgi:hypothetical protein